MAKRTRESERQGMTLSTRLTLIMTLALAAVMTGASVVLFKTTSQLTSSARETTLVSAARLTNANQLVSSELRRLTAERDLLASIEKLYVNASKVNPELLRMRDEMSRMKGERVERIAELKLNMPWRQVESAATEEFDDGRIKRVPVELGAAKSPADLYRVFGD